MEKKIYACVTSQLSSWVSRDPWWPNVYTIPLWLQFWNTIVFILLEDPLFQSILSYRWPIVLWIILWMNGSPRTEFSSIYKHEYSENWGKAGNQLLYECLSYHDFSLGYAKARLLSWSHSRVVAYVNCNQSNQRSVLWADWSVIAGWHSLAFSDRWFLMWELSLSWRNTITVTMRSCTVLTLFLIAGECHCQSELNYVQGVECLIHYNCICFNLKFSAKFVQGR